MGKEIDLLYNYPKVNRDIKKRVEKKTEDDRRIGRKFGKDFFDGDRKYGYGGLNYHPKYWSKVVDTFIDHWSLDENSSILDVGCAKGFMMYDFSEKLPKMNIQGIDISNYAIENCKEEIKNKVKVGNAKSLEFDDNSFDFVLSINTIHNLEIDECELAIKEIERVKRKGAYIVVDAYRNEFEKERLLAWVLTAKTILSVEDWIKLFNKCGYTGDYFWFTP
tara:strand:+ start:692 stop:1351 length:660 start_codon:yes stop_codon:yes gene_type:complete